MRFTHYVLKFNGIKGNKMKYFPPGEPVVRGKFCLRCFKLYNPLSVDNKNVNLK